MCRGRFLTVIVADHARRVGVKRAATRIAEPLGHRADRVARRRFRQSPHITAGVAARQTLGDYVGGLGTSRPARRRTQLRKAGRKGSELRVILRLGLTQRPGLLNDDVLVGRHELPTYIADHVWDLAELMA